MNKIKLNYNETFGTKHSRDYYRGASFHFSGKWLKGTHYISDDYNIDFVVHGQVLLACAKSHLATPENEPKNFIKDENGNIIGIASNYWDLVISGINGVSPGIRINQETRNWEICSNVSVPLEEQIWNDTGISAKMTFSDLTDSDIDYIRNPIIETINTYLENLTTSIIENDAGYVTAHVEDNILVLE